MSKTAQSIILGIMCLILTIGISIQVRTVSSNGTTISSNQEINNLKGQVLKMKEKYESTYVDLEDLQNTLENTRKNVTNNDEELKKLEEEIKNSNILLGTTEVTGPGVTITLQESNVNYTTLAGFSEDYLIHYNDILRIVNELWNAGAEAIEVNGQRIVNSTSINCDGNVILINGEKVGPSFTINAIGNSTRMTTLKRTQGILQLMEESAIKVTFKEVENLTIPKYTGVTTFKFAKTIK